ncbi:MAG TPA: short-chain dehydrogenase, partial [Alcanivorax sp.]|nr:short-chain dehydrogenase [Alcanivorax sp.]
MELKDKIVVVTGAAGGIGRALAQAFAEAGAKKIVCVDLDGDGAEATAKMVDG